MSNQCKHTRQTGIMSMVRCSRRAVKDGYCTRHHPQYVSHGWAASVAISNRLTPPRLPPKPTTRLASSPLSAHRKPKMTISSERLREAAQLADSIWADLDDVRRQTNLTDAWAGAAEEAGRRIIAFAEALRSGVETPEHLSPLPWLYQRPLYGQHPHGMADWIEDATGNIVVANVGHIDGPFIVAAANARSGVERRDAVIEECAKVADDHASTWGNAMGSPARVIADAIRTLKDNTHGA